MAKIDNRGKAYEILMEVIFPDFIVQELRRIILTRPYNLESELDRNGLEEELNEKLFPEATDVKVLDYKEALLQKWVKHPSN